MIPTPAVILFLFVFAGAVRTVYSLVCYNMLGADGLMGPDSHGFLQAAQWLADGGSVLTAPMDGKQGFPIDMMPVPFLLMSSLLSPGTVPGPLSFVLLQGWIDAGLCLLIGFLAHRLWPGTFILAAVVAALNPTQVVMSGLYYTDTLFTFLAFAGLVAAVEWLRQPRIGYMLATGLAWGLALMTRPFIQYWIVIAAVLLLVLAIAIARASWKRRAGQVLAMLAVCAAIASPIALRNQDAFGTMRLSAQAGSHLLFWVLPLVKEFEDGTPRDLQVSRRNAELAADEKYQATTDYFARSDYLAAIATAEFREVGVIAIASVWVKGAALNLAAPASTISPPISNLPRDSFFATAGDNLPDKIWNFLFENKNATYAQILLLSAAPMPFWIAAAIVGLIVCIRRGGTVMISALILFLWAGYTLGINGPIISPKYRLPLEPVWVVFLTIGIVALRDRLARKKTA